MKTCKERRNENEEKQDSFDNCNCFCYNGLPLYLLQGQKSQNKAGELEDVDCIIVLGCQVRDDGSLSHMLRDRLMRGLELYEAGAASKLLMSGDYGREDYDEVGAMKNYATENGVPSENVFMDHAGFSTYESRTFIILYKPNYGNRTVVESGVLCAFRGRKDSFNS